MDAALSVAAEEGSPEAQSPPSILKVEILLKEEDAAEGSGEPVREEEEDDDFGGKEEGGGACWVYFTSGTSGMPKVYTQHNPSLDLEFRFRAQVMFSLNLKTESTGCGMLPRWGIQLLPAPSTAPSRARTWTSSSYSFGFCFYL